jgi:hypothetical protein
MSAQSNKKGSVKSWGAIFCPYYKTASRLSNKTLLSQIEKRNEKFIFFF